MMILGITGGTGCGKTTLLKLIAQRGGLVLDCDEIYHRLLETDLSLLDTLKSRFPESFSQGSLNRKELGRIVFSDAGALADLNSITHRAVHQEVLRALQQEYPHAAIDAIGLFESSLHKLCDITVAVTAPLESRVSRLMTRDGIPESYARSRIAAQHEESWYRQRCDFVLENVGTQEQFHKKCIAFLDARGII